MVVCFVMKVGWFVLAVRTVVWRVYLDYALCLGKVGLILFDYCCGFV